jgi:hypothetical protein
MPYIKANDGRREALQRGESAQSAGELNYQMFYAIKHISDIDLLEINIKSFVVEFLGKKPNYQRYNDMTGALIRCKKEVERRLAYRYLIIAGMLEEIMESYDDEIAKYEDLKIDENGDVE